MGLALLELGYEVVGARLDMAEPLLAGDYETPIKEAGKFQALQDVPWAALYKELDDAYPNSKFILTERDEEEWLNSALKHFKDNYFDLHKWLYGEGVMAGNEALYLERYRRHNKEVREYFKNRPEDFLVMNLKAGDGWETLCHFLKLPIPNKPFPYENKGKHNFTLKDKFYHFFRSRISSKNRRKILNFLGYKDRRNRFNNHEANKKALAKNHKKS